MKFTNCFKKIRTRMFTNQSSQLCTMLFMLICFQFTIAPIRAININSLMRSHNLANSNGKFENVTVQSLAENSTVADDSRILLKINGLPIEIIADDAISVKPTFSLELCDRNASDFQKITKLSNSLIVLLSDFNFNEHSAAYLCLFHIKANSRSDNNDIQALHMGIQSKFQR